MLNSPILEVGLGLVLVYLVLALVCTSVNEYIAQLLHLRAANLWTAIQGLFPGKEGSQFAASLYAHPLIRSLWPKKQTASGVLLNGFPSYIPAEIFSLALLEQLGLVGAEPNALSNQSSLLKELEDATTVEATILTVIGPLIHDAGTDIKKARANIEAWFNNAMERASGWYKRKVQAITLAIAFGIVLAVNGDTLMLSERLWTDNAERARVVAAASSAGSLSSFSDLSHLAPLNSGIAPLLGWSTPVGRRGLAAGQIDPRQFPSGWGWLTKLVGLMLTAYAASLGAPFWFDTLQKIVKVRSSGNGADADDPGGKTSLQTLNPNQAKEKENGQSGK